MTDILQHLAQPYELITDNLIIFKQLAYGRTQSAFSEDGLPIGAGLEDLGKGLRSQVGTMYSTGKKGVRYLEMAEGYVLKLALDEDNEDVYKRQYVLFNPLA